MNLLYDLDTDEFKNKDAAHGTELDRIKEMIKNNLKELIANLGMSAEDNKLFGIREPKESQSPSSLSPSRRKHRVKALTIGVSGDDEDEERKEETAGFLNKEECRSFREALIELRRQKRSQGHHENENEPMM